MILVDTSVWIDHLRAGDAELATLLNGSQVLMHPFLLGELACGVVWPCWLNWVFSSWLNPPLHPERSNSWFRSGHESC